MIDPDPKVRVHVEPDRYGLLVLVTMERERDGRRVVTTMREAPAPDDPVIRKLKRSLMYD